jgi:hypothetical protein
MDDLSLVKYAATVAATIASLPTIEHHFPNFREKLNVPVGQDEPCSIVTDFHAAMDILRPKMPLISLQLLTNPEVMKGQPVQNFCTDLLVKDSHEALLAREQLNFQEDRKTWIKSLKSAEAGRWLTVKHTSGKFSLTCDQFQAALCYRMYMPQPRLLPHKRCTCRTARSNDERGHHLTTGCPIGPWRIKTHDNLRDEICALFKAYGIAYTKEELLCFGLENGKRPDISVAAGQMGNPRKVLLDVSVTAVLTQATEGRANPPGEAARLRFEDKNRTYNEKANNNNHSFLPIVFESTGGIHPKSLEFLKAVAKDVTDDQRGAKEDALFNYFMTSLSVCLQRGLANAFINGRTRIHGSGEERYFHDTYTYSREAVEEYALLRGGGE